MTDKAQGAGGEGKLPVGADPGVMRVGPAVLGL